MTQDYRPECNWCKNKLRKKERTRCKNTTEKICKKCYEETIQQYLGLHKGEDYYG